MADRVRRLQVLVAIIAVCGVIVVSREAFSLPDRRDFAANTRSYTFTARITKNSGVIPFKVGESIHGTFTYDRAAAKQEGHGPEFARYHSRINSISFALGDDRFEGTDPVAVGVSTYSHAETLYVGSPDLLLPKGWEHTKSKSTSFTIFLQNAPSQNILKRPLIPDSLWLADFPKCREFRLDFFNGVRFPGGEVRGRATVFTEVVDLVAVKPK